MPNHSRLLLILVVLACAVFTPAGVGQSERPGRPIENTEEVKRRAKQQEEIKELAAREHISEAEAAERLKVVRGDSTAKHIAPYGRKSNTHKDPSAKVDLTEAGKAKQKQAELDRTLKELDETPRQTENERGSEEHDRHANRGCKELTGVQRERCEEAEKKK